MKNTIAPTRSHDDDGGERRKRNRLEFNPGSNGLRTDLVLSMGPPKHLTVVSFPVEMRVAAPYLSTAIQLFPSTFGGPSRMDTNFMKIDGPRHGPGISPPRFLCNGHPVSILYTLSPSDITLQFSAFVEFGTGPIHHTEHGVFAAAFYVLQEITRNVKLDDAMQAGLESLIRVWELQGGTDDVMGVYGHPITAGHGPLPLRRFNGPAKSPITQCA